MIGKCSSCHDTLNDLSFRSQADIVRRQGLGLARAQSEPPGGDIRGRLEVWAVGRGQRALV